MPLYEFRCVKCGTVFSVVQRMSENNREKMVRCPQCGARECARVYSVVYAKTSRKS